MSLLPQGVKADYPRTETGFAWFNVETAQGLLLEARKADLPKRTGLDPARVQVGPFRFRYWGLEDDIGRFATLESHPPKL